MALDMQQIWQNKLGEIKLKSTCECARVLFACSLQEGSEAELQTIVSGCDRPAKSPCSSKAMQLEQDEKSLEC